MPDAPFASMTFPEIYERFLVAPLFRPFAEALLARLEPRAGDSLLDVACGTGIVARIAREQLGAAARIVGVDVAPPMLAVARQADSTIEWRDGNATALPVPKGEHFSLLTCHQGLQFIADKDAAVREMARVLDVSGRLGIATWRPLHELPLMRDINAVVERHVGPIVDSRHSFGESGPLQALLAKERFSDVRTEIVAHEVAFADGALFARLNAMAAIGMSERGKALKETERGELAGHIAAETQDLISRHTSGGTFVLPLLTSIATARRAAD